MNKYKVNKNEISLFQEQMSAVSSKDYDEGKELEKRFDYLEKKASLIYDFVFTYSNYMTKRKDYGTGENLSLMEAQILNDVVDNEGVTVTELSKKWRKTKSAISQIIKNLLKKEYVYRVNSKKDAKFFFLYPNDKAKDFSLAHKRYDNIDIAKTTKTLLKKFSVEDLIIFDRVLEEYTKIFKEQENL